MTSIKLTTKQCLIMEVVMTGNANMSGVTVSWCDTNQIMNRLPYSACRESLIQILRKLEDVGLVESRIYGEKRRGRRRTIYVPTNKAFDVLRTSHSEGLGESISL